MLRLIKLVDNNFFLNQMKEGKKRNPYIMDFYCSSRVRQDIMELIRNKNHPERYFGDLELVDKELFFISSNRRDT